MATFLQPPTSADGTSLTSVYGVLSMNHGAIAQGFATAGAAAGNTATRGLWGNNQASTVPASCELPFACRLQNFRVQCDKAGLGGGTNVTVTIFKGGVATPIVVDLGNAVEASKEGFDSIHSALGAVGDSITVVVVAGSIVNATALVWTLELVPV